MHSKVEESLSTMGGIASKINDDVSLQRQKDKVVNGIFVPFLPVLRAGDARILIEHCWCIYTYIFFNLLGGFFCLGCASGEYKSFARPPMRDVIEMSNIEIIRMTPFIAFELIFFFLLRAVLFTGRSRPSALGAICRVASGLGSRPLSSKVLGEIFKESSVNNSRADARATPPPPVVSLSVVPPSVVPLSVVSLSVVPPSASVVP